MAVAEYWEVAGSASVDTKGERTYTRNWKVRTTNLTDQPPTVWGTGFASVLRYDPYPFDSGALAVSLDATPMTDLGFYEVSIKYTSKPFDDGNQSQDPSLNDRSISPPSRPWEITFGATHGTRLLTRDVVTGAAIANSAGQPFDPPPEIPSSNLTIQITAFKNIATFDPVAKVLIYQDRINASNLLMLVSPATTTVFPAKTLRCNEYKFGSHIENGIAFWQLDLTLEYKWNGWNPISILDCGTTYIKSGSLPPQPCLDAQGNPVTTPIPLDGSGRPLLAGGTLVYLNYSGYVEANFDNILV